MKAQIRLKSDNNLDNDRGVYFRKKLRLISFERTSVEMRAVCVAIDAKQFSFLFLSTLMTYSNVRCGHQEFSLPINNFVMDALRPVVVISRSFFEFTPPFLKITRPQTDKRLNATQIVLIGIIWKGCFGSVCSDNFQWYK